jgi:hypothetical protein
MNGCLLLTNQCMYVECVDAWVIVAGETCREIAEILLAGGADHSLVDFVGYTPLLVCCTTGRCGTTIYQFH